MSKQSLEYNYHITYYKTDDDMYGLAIHVNLIYSTYMYYTIYLKIMQHRV